MTVKKTKKHIEVERRRIITIVAILAGLFLIYWVGFRTNLIVKLCNTVSQELREDKMMEKVDNQIGYLVGKISISKSAEECDGLSNALKVVCRVDTSESYKSQLSALESRYLKDTELAYKSVISIEEQDRLSNETEIEYQGCLREKGVVNDS